MAGSSIRKLLVCIEMGIEFRTNREVCASKKKDQKLGLWMKNKADPYDQDCYYNRLVVRC